MAGIKLSCPNCQASGKDEHHDEIIEWVGQKYHQRAVITAAVTLLLCILCFMVSGSFLLDGLLFVGVLFGGWVVRKSFQRQANVYMCNKCQAVFNP